MAKCVISCYAVHSITGGHGTAYAVCMCTTHQWDFGNLPTMAQTQCPIGRIEDKVDEAVERIEQYVQDHFDAQHS